jgi:hypothetical protein
MPRNKSADLASFQDWLISECGMSARSASVYASRVRALLRECPPSVSEAELLRIMEGRPENHSCFATSWNRYVDFGALQGIAISRIPSRRRVRAAAVPNLPDDSGRALVEVIQSGHLKLKLIPRLKWRDVRPTVGQSWEIKDPDQPGLFYVAPAKYMRVICDWANGIDEIVGDRPFIPAHPLGMKPMPLATVRRSIAEHKNTPDR